jgi:hypothetical protein
MNASSSLNEQIAYYLKKLNLRQKEAILTVAKTFVKEETNMAIYSDEFMKELNQRTLSLEAGSVKGIGWDQVKNNAHAALRSKKK